MTDHQQAAVEAVDDALRADQWDGDPEDLPGSMATEAEIAVEAAEPHLRRKWADEARKLLNLRADFQGPHATARNRGIHDVISLLEGAG